MLARQIRRLRPGLVLLQHPDDLIFREPCSLHLSVLQEGRTLNPRGGKSQRQVSPMLGLTGFQRPATKIAGIELMHRIRKGQFKLDKLRVKYKTAPEIWNAVLAA